MRWNGSPTPAGRALLPGRLAVYVGRPQSLDAVRKAVAADAGFSALHSGCAVEAPRICGFRRIRDGQGLLIKPGPMNPHRDSSRPGGARLVRLTRIRMAEVEPVTIRDLDTLAIERCMSALRRFKTRGGKLDPELKLELQNGHIGSVLQHIIGLYGIPPFIAAELVGEASQKNRLERLVSIVEIQQETGSIREEMHARQVTDPDTSESPCARSCGCQGRVGRRWKRRRRRPGCSAGCVALPRRRQR